MIPQLPNLLPATGNITLPAAASVAAAPSTYDIYMGLLSQFMMYEIFAILLFVVLIVVAMMFLPYFPWLKRIFTHKKLIGLIDSTGNIKFTEDITLNNETYYLKERPLPFVKRYQLEYQLSGVPLDIVNIDLKYINHPTYIQWEKDMIAAGYDGWKKIDMALLLNRLPKNPETENIIKKLGFETWEQAEQTINPLGFTEKSQELLLYFQTMPVEEIDGYGYKFPTKCLNAEADDRRELLGTTHAKRLMSTLIIGIVILIVMIGGALAYVMVSK
jgi:hypothetical protein